MKLQLWQQQLLRFGVVGTTAASVYVAAAFLLLNGFGIPLAMANIGAFFISALVNYLGNAFWSFGAGGGIKSLLRFIVLCFIALPVTMLISQWVIVTEKPDYYAILLTAVVIPLISFTVQKLWVFRGS